MQKLYVFAIGGSGERVMYSFIMSLVAGTPIDAQEVIPVFIDNDTTSKALTNCLELINAYRDSYDGRANKLQGVNSLYARALGANPDIWPTFCRAIIDEPVILNVSGQQISDLEGIIGCPNNTTDSTLQRVAAEKNLLFTNDDLSMELNVGFVGNPNIGSVVLNTLSLNMSEFKDDILGKVSAADGVFVVGSLFGGTGAAGFPLIVNKFSENVGAAGKPLVGGVAVLPYFTTAGQDTSGIIDTERWDVQSGTFAAKTRAALMYYDKYMTHMDYLYYVGDDNVSTYNHSVGGVHQDNPANLVDLMAAMSIIDFAKQQRPESIVYKVPTWGFTDKTGTTSNLSGIPDIGMRRAFAKFFLTKTIFEKDCFLKYNIENHHEHVANIGFTEGMRMAVIDENSLKQLPVASGLNRIFKLWDIWWADLSSNPNNSRHLLVFPKDLDITPSNVTTKFYTPADQTGHNWGIAKTHIDGIIHRRAVANDPKISNELIAAYKSLFPNGREEDKANFTPDRKLATLLQIISIGLDNVINTNCSIN